MTQIALLGISVSLGQRSGLREESSKTNVILVYKLFASILSAICSVIQQSFTAITHYMMGNMTVKLPCIRPHFSYSVLCH